MSFVEPAFLVLLGAVLVLAPRLPLNPQNAFLAFASLVFYGWHDPRLAGLLAAEGTLGWMLALLAARGGPWRRLAVGVAIVVTTGPIALTKASGLAIVGLSFYGLQILGYVLDVATGRARARRSLVDVLLFGAFFPQLVAGPIERAEALLTQIERPRRVTRHALGRGAGLALWGAVQKLVVADPLGVWVDRVFALSEAPPVLVWAGVLGFTVQLLADFKGYTDLARGLATMLGFDLVENFHEPYRAQGPADFWRRWHASLGRWLHDHVYTPLRGAGGVSRSLAAAWSTFVLSALWHGVGWGYLAWGLWHALAWTVERVGRARGLRLPAALHVPATFVVVVVGWLPFREQDPARLLHTLGQVPWSGDVHARMAALSLAGATLLHALVLASGAAVVRRRHAPAPAAALAALGLSLVLTWGETSPRAFVYFAF